MTTNDPKKRYFKALRAEAVAVRAVTQAMLPPVFDDQLKEAERRYKKAVEERKAAQQAMEAPPWT